MPTHHDYDADGTLRDEMLDAQNIQREERQRAIEALGKLSDRAKGWLHRACAGDYISDPAAEAECIAAGSVDDMGEDGIQISTQVMGLVYSEKLLAKYATS